MLLIFSQTAAKDLLTIPNADARRLRDALRQVAEVHPERMSFATELVGKANYWRLRKGDWRAIYHIIGDEMTVVKVEKRGEVYR